MSEPDFYDEIYHGKKYKTHRDKWYNLDFLGDGLAFTLDHDVHAMRRQALSPYFSMQAIRTLEPRITDVVQQMIDRLHEAHRSGAVLILGHVFAALTVDIVSAYAFGEENSTKLMQDPEFGRWWSDLTSSVRLNNFGRHFRLAIRLLMTIPASIMARTDPMLARFMDWQTSLEKQVHRAMDESAEDKSNAGMRTVFHELINSDLPPQDRSVPRLRDEASMVIGAGGETTAQALTRTFYHLLVNPQFLRRLREELKSAMPDPKEMPSLAMLQNLPYLNAVVEEGVRISFPVAARSPRVFEDHALQLGEWTIEPGTSISMSPYMVTMSEKIFPEPFKFQPDRWLGNKELRKYQVTFGKGKRVCLGQSLAYAELLFGIAMIVRNFELELYETTWDDVELVHDFFIAMPKLGSNGVRVKVVRELS